MTDLDGAQFPVRLDDWNGICRTARNQSGDAAVL